jgi:ectoine hydroxylase-related dioxygenase (phytanoyl-CoA dioxygenase family)
MNRTTDFGVEITDEQVAFFRENGFLSLERITTDEEVEWLKGIYDQLFSQRLGEKEGEYFDLAGQRGHDGREVLPQVLGPEKKFPELRDTIYHRNARKVVSRLFDVPAAELTIGGHMILKPPFYGAETPWHQDEAYWPEDMLPQSASAWLPLDVATLESGCLHFIPGSHRDDIHWHDHINHDPRVHGLMTDEADAARAVACPLPPGGATFHHSRTLHFAGPNKTANPRRAYIAVVNGPVKKLDKPLNKPWLEDERRALEAIDAMDAMDAQKKSNP